MFEIGFYQFHPTFGQVNENLAQVVRALERVTADLIVLPELAFTGYYFKDRDELKHLAQDPEASATVDSLVSLCRARDLHVVTGFAEKLLVGERAFGEPIGAFIVMDTQVVDLIRTPVD